MSLYKVNSEAYLRLLKHISDNRREIATMQQFLDNTYFSSSEVLNSEKNDLSTSKKNNKEEVEY